MTKSVYTHAYVTFIDRLAQARKDAGVSQVELARRIGRDQPFISLVERKVRRLDVIEFYVIAHAIGADPGTLLTSLSRDLPSSIDI